MNLAKCASAALRGLSPHVPEAHIRKLQRAIISQLFWHMEHVTNRDSCKVQTREWVYVKDKKS